VAFTLDNDAIHVKNDRMHRVCHPSFPIDGTSRILLPLSRKVLCKLCP
jgi:hypothetical protein